jgi:hypothetical protein
MVTEVVWAQKSELEALRVPIRPAVLSLMSPSVPHRSPFFSYSSFLDSAECTVVASFLNMDKTAVP